LAGSRAAASVSLTIGVAFATLLAAGGILIGPAILDCNHESAGIGACLRGKAEQAGLLHEQPRGASSAPVATVELPAPPLMAPEPQRPQGWLEANANEYQAPLSNGSVQLTPPIGAIGAAGRLTLKPALQGGADVRAPAGVVAANGQTLPAPEATAQIALAQPPGRLAAAGRPSLAAADCSERTTRCRQPVSSVSPCSRRASTSGPANSERHPHPPAPGTGQRSSRHPHLGQQARGRSARAGRVSAGARTRRGHSRPPPPRLG